MPDIEPFATDKSITIDYETSPPEQSRQETPLSAKSIGDTIGDYQLQQRLGQGGMGAVYRALQNSTGRIVALKLIRADRLADLPESERNAWLDRFRTEAQAAARLDHDNAVTVFEVGTVQGQPFYSMKLVAGDSLADRIRVRPVDPMAAAAWIEQIARAVHHAHERGILHRDLKPSNVLIDAADKALVTDFGIAKLDRGSMTQTGQVLGTPQYMAPEQAIDSAHLTPACDVYGLGATLYAALTGRPPFQAATIAETVRQVLEVDCVPPRTLNPAVPRDLETICLKCLSKEPKWRYRSAVELAEDLRRFRAGEPIVARPVGRMERAWKWTRRRPVAASLLATLVLGAALGAVASLQWTRARRAEADAALRQTMKYADDALLAAQRGQWVDALSLIDDAIAHGHPDAYGLKLMKVRILEANSDRKTARALITQIRDEPIVSQHEGFCKLLQGQYLLGIDDDKAIELLQQALTLNLPPAEREFAMVLVAKTIPEAREHAEKAVAIQPWHYEALYEAHRFSLLLGYLEAARDYNRRAMFLFPDDIGIQAVSVTTNYLIHCDLLKAKKELEGLRGRLPDPEFQMQSSILELMDFCFALRKNISLNVSPDLGQLTKLAAIGSQISQRYGSKPLQPSESISADSMGLQLMQMSPFIRRKFKEGIGNISWLGVLTNPKAYEDRLDLLAEVWPCAMIRLCQLMRDVSKFDQAPPPAAQRNQRIREFANEAVLIAEMPSFVDLRRLALDYAFMTISSLVIPKKVHECPDDYAFAVRVIRRRLECGPIDQFDHPGFMKVAGTILARAGEVNLARGIAEAIDRLHPSTDVQRAILRSQIELAAGQYAAALVEARAGLKDRPENKYLIDIAEEAAANLERAAGDRSESRPALDAHQALAERVVRGGGSVTVQTTVGTNRSIQSIDLMPKIAFQLTGLRSRGLTFDESIQSLLSKIDSLKVLELINSSITDDGLACLSGCTQLTTITIDNAPLTDAGLRHLSGMARLQTLTLRNTSVTGIGLTHITSPELTELTVDGAATDVGMKDLSRFNRLRGLTIRGPLTDRVMECLRDCEFLRLTITAPLTDRAFEDLAKATSLGRLGLTETQITDRGLAKIVESYPKLNHLVLGNANITDAGLAALELLADSLQSLGLWKTPVTDEGMAVVAKLRNLTTLGLSYTGITDHGLKTIAAMSKLEFVYLNDTKITDAGIAHLEKMTRLTTLDLRQTAVTKPAVIALQKKLPKCKISFDDK